MIFPLVSIDVNWFFTLMILLLTAGKDSHSVHSALQEDLCIVSSIIGSLLIMN